MTERIKEQAVIAEDLAAYLRDEYDADISALDLLESLATFGVEVLRSPEGDAAATSAYYSAVTGAAVIPYNREVLASVLVHHYRKDLASCGCGWASTGESHPAHVIDVYEQSVTA